MLYCTRALVDIALRCILLVTWLLDFGFSSKNKSVYIYDKQLIDK